MFLRYPWFMFLSSLVFSLQAFCTVCFVRITRPHDHTITYSQPLPNYVFTSTSTSTFYYPDSSIVDSSLASNKRHRLIFTMCIRVFQAPGIFIYTWLRSWKVTYRNKLEVLYLQQRRHCRYRKKDRKLQTLVWGYSMIRTSIFLTN